MKQKIALIAVVLFTIGLFASFAEAKGCSGKGNGACVRQKQQNQDRKKSKDGTCNGEKKAKGQANGNSGGYRGGGR